MKEFASVKYPTLNCVENCLANYIVYRGKSYLPILQDSWDFRFRENALRIEDAFSEINDYRRYMKNILKFAATYCGISYKRIHEIGEDLNCEYPLLVLTDIYDCMWTDGYLRLRDAHAYLILEKTAEEFLILDSYFKEHSFWVNRKQIGEVLSVYRLSFANESVTFNKKNYYEWIHQNLDKYYVITKDIKSFSEYLIQEKDKSLDFEQQIEFSALLIKLTRIINARKNMISLLAEDEGGSDELVEMFKEVVLKWSRVKLLFIRKLTKKEKEGFEVIAEIVEDISKSETKILYQIINERKDII